jgi:hypothetical protein
MKRFEDGEDVRRKRRRFSIARKLCCWLMRFIALIFYPCENFRLGGGGEGEHGISHPAILLMIRFYTALIPVGDVAGDVDGFSAEICKYQRISADI